MEKKLWRYLKGKQLDGYRFRQQHGFGPFVLDFYCPTLRLCVEVDGGVHQEESFKEKDEDRTVFLNENRIKVIRVTNDEVETDIDKVLEKIRTFISNECK